MKILKLTTALLALSAVSAHAGGVGGGNADSNWTIYGWQNYSYEMVDLEGGREYDRIQGNAANIGFSASIDTGVMMGGQAVNANMQCEQFTFHNRLTSSGWCNRNSKLSLSGSFGVVMVGQWLLPYNEMVAQWVDPFYDAGDDSHSSIMGSVGHGTLFYNGGTFPLGGGDNDFNYGTGATDLGFNRRQEETIQYFSPNMNGFTFRIATSSRAGGDTAVANDKEVDPRIWSMGAAYEKTLDNGDSAWFAITYQKHDEWAARAVTSEDSEDESWRIAGRYIHQWGNGSFSRLSAMWENLEYDVEGFGDTDDDEAGFQTGWSLFNGVEGGDLKFDRDAWMISGIHNFGNGLDARFSYMRAEEYDCDSGCVDDDTDASAVNLGLFYTMPAGTGLRLTYSEVDDEDNANYAFAISGVGAGTGNKAKMYGIGMVQWF